MKNQIKKVILSTSVILLSIISLSNNFQAQTHDPPQDKWLTSSELASVWLLTQMTDITRAACCAPSDEDNACNLAVQSNIQLCKSGRTVGFVAQFEIKVE